MNVLILSDAADFLGRDLENKTLKLFNENEVTYFNAFSMKVSDCKGCFRCWVKTPGECVIKDDTQKFNEAFAATDLFIVLSKIKYGCYSGPVKKVLDRSIPNLLPFFKALQGEIHHPQRYTKKKNGMFIAYRRGISGEDAVIFSELAQRNAINFGLIKHGVFFCEKEEDFEKKILKGEGKQNGNMGIYHRESQK